LQVQADPVNEMDRDQRPKDPTAATLGREDGESVEQAALHNLMLDVVRIGGKWGCLQREFIGFLSAKSAVWFMP
jgi:hypothetical protein